VKSERHNDHRGAFDDISDKGGPAVQTQAASRGLAVEDFNGDGRLDLVITNLNDVPSLLLNTGEAGNWIIVGLQADRGNRSAIGARVSVEAQGRKQTREVRSASSFYSSSGLRLHFGLATATRIDKLTVFWPGGGLTQLKGLPVNRVLLVRERDGMPPLLREAIQNA